MMIPKKNRRIPTRIPTVLFEKSVAMVLQKLINATKVSSQYMKRNCPVVSSYKADVVRVQLTMTMK